MTETIEDPKDQTTAEESSGAEQPARRASFVDHEVVYVSVGASSAPDLLRFPPTGTTPFVREQRLGSGAERFLMASTTLMTWGAQRASGIEVSEVQQSDEDHYTGVLFDADGTPAPAPEAEVRYGPDGEAFLSAGATALFTWPRGRVRRRVRVVYTVEEARRVGFAIGTADTEGVVGETLYLVDHRDDDSVWAIARGFHQAPDIGLFGVRARAAIRLAERDASKMLAALAPGVAARNGGAHGSDASGDSASESD